MISMRERIEVKVCRALDNECEQNVVLWASQIPVTTCLVGYLSGKRRNNCLTGSFNMILLFLFELQVLFLLPVHCKSIHCMQSISVPVSILFSSVMPSIQFVFQFQFQFQFISLL